jgi:signal recognition particle GTPase
MEKDWVVVYTTNKIYQAEIFRELLGDHDIDSFIINKQDSSYKFGNIEVYVRRNNILKAKMLVKEFES